MCAFIGTKAQYIKTAPVLHELDRRGIPYRLIDSGQHALLAEDLRAELGVRDPDVRLHEGADITSVPAALAWSLRLGARLRSRRRCRELFGDDARVVLVHGDTPSTLLSALLARRAGLDVVHLEAGLRSRSLLHPFPEELIRLVVMRLATLLVAPSAEAEANLGAMRLRGRTVAVGANTTVEAIAAVAPDPAGGSAGPVVVTMHRVENLHRRSVVDGFVDLVVRIAARWPVTFVVHGPTAAVIADRGHEERLRAAGVELVPLQPHGAFVRFLAAAPFAVVDGGSIQEECALLGVPTLLWRERTERPDGIGANVVLSRYDPAVVDEFLADPARWRRPPADLAGLEPSAAIVDAVVEVASVRRP